MSIKTQDAASSTTTVTLAATGPGVQAIALVGDWPNSSFGVTGTRTISRSGGEVSWPTSGRNSRSVRLASSSGFVDPLRLEREGLREALADRLPASTIGKAIARVSSSSVAKRGERNDDGIFMVGTISPLTLRVILRLIFYFGL